MSCVLVLPVPLRDLAGGQSTLEIGGESVGAVLREAGSLYEPLLDRVLTAEGGLKNSVNVYLNERDIRYLNGLDTAVKDGDEVVLVPIIAGG